MSQTVSVVVGGPQAVRAVMAAMTLRSLHENTSEAIATPNKEEFKDFLPRPTKKETAEFTEYKRRRDREEAAARIKAAPKQEEQERKPSFAEQMLAEEMRSMERFAPAPRSSCGHLPSLAKCENECEIKEIASNTIIPLNSSQPLTALFQYPDSRRKR